MIMDTRNQFAKAVSVAAAAGTALIGDVVDLGTVHRNIGAGRPIYLVLTTDTAIITGGAAGTVKFQLVSAAVSAIPVDGSATVHIDTGTFATGAIGAIPKQIKAGGIIGIFALPVEGATYLEFLGILAITATTTTTAGKINAFLTLDPGTFGKEVYPEGVN